MNIFGWIKEIISPVADVIKDVHTSDEDRLTLRNGLAAIEYAFAEKSLEYEKKVLDYEIALAQAKRDVVVAEASGHSWIQRNWRPTLMMLFGSIVAWNYMLGPMFGVPPAEIPEDAIPAPLWTLITVGIGGYIGGRSMEKIAPAVVHAVKGRKKPGQLIADELGDFS